MKKGCKIVKLIIVLLLIAADITAICLALFIPNDKGGKYIVTEGGKPLIGDKLDIVIPKDAAGQKALAYELYALANENHKNISNVALAVNSVTTTMGVDVNGYRYVVKNDDEYLYLEYSLVYDADGMFLLGLAAKDSTMFAKRAYTNGDMEKMYFEKTLSPTNTIDGSKITYKANWKKLHSSGYENKPIYCSEQTETLEITDQHIFEDTIKTASVTYNAEEGYYNLELVLDADNAKTTSTTLPNLKKSSGADDAHYTSIVETIQIWDNGYYKNFLSVDVWKGTLSIINLDSTIRFETMFHYDEESVNFGNYQYAEDLIAKCNGDLQK